MCEQSADELIQEAIDQFNEYILEGDHDSAMDICGEFFGLEPDYMFDLLH